MSPRKDKIFAPLCLALAYLSDSHAQALPTFTLEQAEQGKAVYTRNCARCHGTTLYGSGEHGPPLRGFIFKLRWGGKTVDQLLSLIQSTMPPGGGSKLSETEYANITAHILENYGLPAGSIALSTELATLQTMALPKERIFTPMEVSAGMQLPPWPTPPRPIEQMTAVTDSMLRTPPDSSWLSWRRTQDGGGFSPLKQITRINVDKLRVAWALALPAGPNQTTPLVHDGVIFVYSFGDHLQALDASTGEEFWRYSHSRPRHSSAIVHRNIAVYDDKVYVATSDSMVVALESKSGKVIWQQHIGDEFTFPTGGPLVANGVLMLGLAGSQRPGGSFIIALDADTGAQLWKFNTVARPGEPHGNSWNGLPLEQRTGGTIWTAGSYDWERNLALFGPAPTYDTEPLRVPVKRAGITNDALYTDSTIALDPRSGKLRWHYQHMPNDQWDHDWAFERHIVDLPINGTVRSLVITAGKGAIYDAVHARTGEFAFSIDLGLQNIVTAIDERTGKKTINRELTPGNGKTVTVCPHTNGAKSWLPASYDPDARTLFVSLVEACMDLIPLPKGEQGLLSTGVWPSLRPPAGSDGRYGRLQAINLETRSTVWSARQRAPLTSGTLATQGGLVFVGSLDRWFTAHDSGSGEVLWRARLSDVPTAAPITYLSNGKQYVAVLASYGQVNSQAGVLNPFIPETRQPIERSSAIWVFELP